MDPQLLANLTRLGPVKVDHGMRGLKPTGVATGRMLDSQKESEAEAQGRETKRNHLRAPTLLNALTRLREASDEQAVEKLAREYNLGAGTLKELGKTVNVPTPDEATVRVVVDEGGVEVILKTVRVLKTGVRVLTYPLFFRRNGFTSQPSNSILHSVWDGIGRSCRVVNDFVDGINSIIFALNLDWMPHRREARQTRWTGSDRLQQVRLGIKDADSNAHFRWSGYVLCPTSYESSSIFSSNPNSCDAQVSEILLPNSNFCSGMHTCRSCNSSCPS